MTRIRDNRRRTQDTTASKNRLPWKRYASTTAGSMMLIAVLASGLYALNQSLSIRQWQVNAPAALKAEIEQHLLHAMPHLDFWHARPALLQAELLQSLPDLASVQIQRQLPDTLLIHATPRQPIALWLKEGVQDSDNGAQLYLVDEQGIAYRPRKHGEAADLPVLRMPQKKLLAACQWLSELKKSQPQWFSRSSELFATPDGWKLNLAAGQQWKLPYGVRGLQNIATLADILRQPRWRTGNWRIDTRMETRWFLRPATHGGVI